jgi:hypothetical protein
MTFVNAHVEAVSNLLDTVKKYLGDPDSAVKSVSWSASSNPVSNFGQLSSWTSRWWSICFHMRCPSCGRELETLDGMQRHIREHIYAYSDTLHFHKDY